MGCVQPESTVKKIHVPKNLNPLFGWEEIKSKTQCLLLPFLNRQTNSRIS